MTDKPKLSKILTALHEIMKAVSYVQKGGKNQFHGYKYAGEADLLEKLRPAMIEHGLILIPSGKSVSSLDEHGNTTIEMEYTLAHTSGEVWPEKIMAFGCGNDRSSKGTVGDKGLYKAITGANKYLLFKLFQIETGDDPEKSSAQEGMTKDTDYEDALKGLQDKLRSLILEHTKNNVPHSQKKLQKLAIDCGIIEEERRDTLKKVEQIVEPDQLEKMIKLMEKEG